MFNTTNEAQNTFWATCHRNGFTWGLSVALHGVLVFSKLNKWSQIGCCQIIIIIHFKIVTIFNKIKVIQMINFSCENSLDVPTLIYSLLFYLPVHVYLFRFTPELSINIQPSALWSNTYIFRLSKDKNLFQSWGYKYIYIYHKGWLIKNPHKNFDIGWIHVLLCTCYLHEHTCGSVIFLCTVYI